MVPFYSFRTFSTAGVVGLAIFHISRSRPFELKNSCSCTMSPCYTTDAFSHLVKLNTGCKPHFASSTKRVFLVSTYKTQTFACLKNHNNVLKVHQISYQCSWIWICTIMALYADGCIRKNQPTAQIKFEHCKSDFCTTQDQGKYWNGFSVCATVHVV